MVVLPYVLPAVAAMRKKGLKLLLVSMLSSLLLWDGSAHHTASPMQQVCLKPLCAQLSAAPRLFLAMHCFFKHGLCLAHLPLRPP